jgi:hypothetical protein
MQPSQDLIDQLNREDLEQAMSMTPEQRLLAGGDLFDYACEITKAGIRAQYPAADNATVLSILRDRLELAAQLEERQ